MSDKYFEQRFHRDPLAIGRSITLAGVDYTVIGALPGNFRLPTTYEGEETKTPDVWIPLSRGWNRPEDEYSFQLEVVAKRRASLSLSQLRAALGTLQAHRADPEHEVQQVNVFSLRQEDQSEESNLALFVLLGAVGMLLLIGCANLANLTLARASKRSRELSIRRALGASRGRIIGQLLTESLVLGAAGAGAGVCLAHLTIQGLRRVQLPIPRPEDIEMNWPVFAFAVGVGLLTTLLFGLMPAITTAKVSVNETLKSGGGVGASASLARSRQILTTAEVGLAVILLCGSGLLIRSFVKLVQTGVGFRTEQLSVVALDLPDLRYPDAASRARFYSSVIAKARAIPGVATAAISTTLPLKARNVSTFRIQGRAKTVSLKELPTADTTFVTPDYFRAIGLRVLQGRSFTATDVTRNRRTGIVGPQGGAKDKPAQASKGKRGDGVVVVNQALASKYFPGQNPVGQRLLLEDDLAFEIVGVVNNFLVMGAISDPHPQYFSAGVDAPNALLLLRTKVPPESIADEVRAVLTGIDSELTIPKVETMNQIIEENISDPRAVVILLSIFAGLALLLAMIGVYSVLANLVVSRTREIGIRMALGATPKQVGAMVARQSLWPLGIGLAVGLAGGHRDQPGPGVLVGGDRADRSVDVCSGRGVGAGSLAVRVVGSCTEGYTGGVHGGAAGGMIEMTRLLCLLAFASGMVAQDVHEIVKRFVEAQKKNNQLAEQYSYQQEVTHFKTNKAGEMEKTGTDSYEILFVEGLEYKKWVRHDGQPLQAKQQQEEEKQLKKTAAERRKQRKGGLFTRTVSSGGDEVLLTLFDNRLAGEEEIGGRKAWRIDSIPKVNYKPKNQQEEDAMSFARRTWVDQSESIALRHELRWVSGDTMKPGTVFTLEWEKIHDEVWMCTLLRADYRIQMLKFMKDSGRDEQRNSDFRKFDVKSTITVE